MVSVFLICRYLLGDKGAVKKSYSLGPSQLGVACFSSQAIRCRKDTREQAKRDDNLLFRLAPGGNRSDRDRSWKGYWRANSSMTWPVLSDDPSLTIAHSVGRTV